MRMVPLQARRPPPPHSSYGWRHTFLICSPSSCGRRASLGVFLRGPAAQEGLIALGKSAGAGRRRSVADLRTKVVHFQYPGTLLL